MVDPPSLTPGERVNLVQAWLIVGVPGLVVATGLLVGHNRVRIWAGYALLAILVVFFLFVPGDPISGGVVGLVGVGLLATGRGTNVEAGAREEHEDRKRYTTDPSQA